MKRQDKLEELKRLVERVQKYQGTLKLSDKRFCARFQRFVGSSRTWRQRLCGEDIGDLDVDRWLKNLRTFVAGIEGAGSELTDCIEELPIYDYGVTTYERLQGQTTDRRVAWLIGPTGVGKSWTMRSLADAEPVDTRYIHVNRGAKDSMMMIARQLAFYVGAGEAVSAAGTYSNVIDVLQASPMTLMIDDVHEGGVLMLKLLKHMIDESRVKLLLGTYPTAWAKLVGGSTDAHSEAQQLLGRSLKPINKTWLKGVTAGDVEVYLKATVGGNGECAHIAKSITPTIRKHGNLRVLDGALELARMNAEETGELLEPAMVQAAVHELCPDGKEA